MQNTIFELKLVEKISTKRLKNFYAVSEAFGLLHETLVKLQGKKTIAFKPFLSNNEESLTVISFFSFDKSILEEFKNIIEANQQYTNEYYNLNKRSKVITDYFRICDIEEVTYNLNSTIIYKRKRLYIDSLSKNKLIPHIHTVLDNMSFDYERTTMKGKIKLLIQLFDINKNNVEEKYKLIQQRLNKENNEFYLQINSSSTKNKNIKFSFSGQENKKFTEINFLTNSYGLSTEDYLFPLPI